MNDYRVVPSMKQGSYSFAPSIKKEKGAPCGNSQLSNTIIKRKGPFHVVPTHDTIIKGVGPLKAVPLEETGGTFQ